MSTCGVYYIKNEVTAKLYVGSSVDVDKRFSQHVCDLKANRHHCIYLQRSWNKHGESQFSFGLICEASRSVLHEVERRVLGQYGLDKLYNVTLSVSGGDLITNHPNNDAIRKKRRDVQKTILSQLTPEEWDRRFKRFGCDNPNYGNRWSDSLRKNMAEKKRGRKLSPEAARKARRTIRRNWSDPDIRARLVEKRKGAGNPFYGRTHTEEAKQKIRMKKKGYTPENTVKVVAGGYCFDSVASAARYFQLTSGAMVNRLKSTNGRFADFYYLT